MSPLYAHIACCLDDSPASRRALAEGRRLRAAGPGRLSLVHAAPKPLLFEAGPEGPPVPSPEDLYSERREWLVRLAREVPEAEPVLLEGLAAEAVCEWAAEAGVDLLVTASHHGPIERVLLGSFSRYLAGHAPCSVLLVRPPGQEEPRG
jgi:nucleotide-binding universal stress UspA family protein